MRRYRLFHPSDGLSGEQILQFADSALYRAKEHGKNCVFRIESLDPVEN